jgi:AraC-like DNA-binding protein
MAGHAIISSMYREYPPPAELAGVVECLWRHQLSDGAADRSGAVLPDGRVDVVWIGDGRILLAGPQTRALPRPLRAPFLAVGARFHPGVGPSLLGLPAHELVDAHTPLEAIDTTGARTLAHRLGALDEPDEAVGSLTAALARLAARREAVDPLVQSAARLLERSAVTVREVAHEVALSERQLQRRFLQSVGYGPKTLQRVLRLQRLLAELGRDGGQSSGLARLAATVGYADQAHMTREARELSGLTPVQIERLWRS